MPRGIPNKTKTAKARNSNSNVRLDMNKLSFADLDRVENQARDMKVQKRAEEIDTLKSQVTALVEGAGYTIQELFGKRPYVGRAKQSGGGKTNVTRAEPGKKYVNPDNKDEVYKGRGRRPEWLQNWMTKHGDDFSSLAR